MSPISTRSRLKRMSSVICSNPLRRRLLRLQWSYPFRATLAAALAANRGDARACTLLTRLRRSCCRAIDRRVSGSYLIPVVLTLGTLARGDTQASRQIWIGEHLLQLGRQVGVIV